MLFQRRLCAISTSSGYVFRRRHKLSVFCKSPREMNATATTSLCRRRKQSQYTTETKVEDVVQRTQMGGEKVDRD